MTDERGPDPDTVLEALRDVYDPCCAERGLSVVDMGLIEDLRVHGAHVEVDLVLTSGWCPIVASMSTEIPDRVSRIPGVTSVDVRVLYDRVWTMDRLSEAAREKLVLPLDELLPYRERRVGST